MDKQTNKIVAITSEDESLTLDKPINIPDALLFVFDDIAYISGCQLKSSIRSMFDLVCIDINNYKRLRVGEEPIYYVDIDEKTEFAKLPPYF